MLKSALQKVMDGEDLTVDEMAAAMGDVMDGAADPAVVGAFLVALRLKGETVDEITGAATAMRQRMQVIHTRRTLLLDTCGTGGSGTGAFNISTAVAFVVAAAGVGVAKHGNRAVSSKSGSADVLLACGLNVEAGHHTVEQCLDELGIGFLFAPSCHPAMRHAAPIRRALGMRTIFNLLGPLTNPARAKRQLLGVFSEHWVEPLAAVLGKLGSDRAWVVHGSDGLDELTVCAENIVAEWNGGILTTHRILPGDVGLPTYPQGSLKGGAAEENAHQLKALLGGKKDGALRDAVALNAGAALTIADVTPDLLAGVTKAQELLASGKPLRLLEALCQKTTVCDEIIDR